MSALFVPSRFPKEALDGQCSCPASAVGLKSPFSEYDLTFVEIRFPWRNCDHADDWASHRPTESESLQY